MRLIDADALKNAFNVFYGGVGHAAIASWIINDAPTVDAVEVVHGEWEYVDFVSPTIHCSVCKELAPWNIVDDYHSEHTNFCPNCGAKMDGDSND